VSRRAAIVWMLAAVLVGVGFAAVRQRTSDGNDVDRAARIVMFGDSLTEQGNWLEMFPDRNVIGSGFSGYTTEQLTRLARDAVRSRPTAVFVLSGTNDVFQGQSAEWTADRLGELITAIQSESPDTRIVIQTLLPSEGMSAELVATNDAIRRVATARGLDVLDLYPAFDDGSGRLRAAETYDGVHLTGAGYARWVALLEPWFDRVETEPAP
jgi:lysophospholipase L1-like esterase